MKTGQGLSFLQIAARLRGLTLALVLGATATLGAAHPQSDREHRMLALGDSVVFGYITQDGFAYLNPDNFLAYPDYVGRALRLDVTNAACPGEATAGFISSTGADNGCRPFRTNFPLHAGYDTTQLAFATQFLTTHKRTRLVTIGLGANDGFLLISGCKGDAQCIQNGLPAALGAVFSNMNTILSNLRATGYKGVLMVVNYYSVDYSDPQQTGLTVALNQTLAAAAAAHGAVVADAFTAFQAATARAGGKTCQAALLNADPKNPALCDVHPSLSGQQLLAKTVRAAYAAVRHHDD